MLRRLLLRLALALAGMLLLCVAAYVAFGLVLRSRLDLAYDWLGQDKAKRIYFSYANAWAWALPGDSDGDGLADGVEMWLRTDPARADPLDLEFVRDLSRAFVEPESVAESEGISLSRRWRLNREPERYPLILHSGKPLRVKGRVRLEPDDDNLAPFSNSFRLKITWQGAEVALVPVATDGAISFEISQPANIDADWRVAHTLAVGNAATGAHFFDLHLHCVEAQFPIEVTVVDSMLKQLPEFVQTDAVEALFYDLRWETPAAPSTGVIIEAMPEHGGSPWQAVHIISSSRTSVRIRHWDYGPPWKDAPLKFRAIPVR